ncbi:MAG: small multi-drug export protein [Clostridia bacterium]|nr:small multi-drug export protein [Clostridia bacterium]
MSLLVKYLITFLVGMVPVIELRGAIPIGVGLGLSYFEAFICSFLGNIVPIYFIVKFAGPLFDFFGRWKPFKKIIDFATDRATKKIEETPRLQTYTAFALWLFVAIPIPGTGAWVGSLIANFLNLPPKKAIPPIVLGVLTAGIIVLALTAGAKGGLEYIFSRTVS